ncbi:MAG: 2-dehydro-3-deoxyglucarate aldolase [Actinobacteria bacterium]|nr:2-dehydro-3-deoxyglucarate aldolase [Actinomycetota bacterium]
MNLGSPLTAEIMGTAGFDWLVMDLEHGAGDETALLGQLQALASTDTAALVRVDALELPRFMRALDLGADGVLVPRVRTVEEARQSVANCRYAGSRGVARFSRSWRWGRVSRPFAEVDAEIVCAIQIETVDALTAVDEIAAVDGVDVLFVGPSDLAQALGLDCGPDDPRLLDRVAEVAAAAREHGKAAGVLVGTPEQASAYRDLGFTFLGCGTEAGMLALSSSAIADQMRDLARPAATELTT